MMKKLTVSAFVATMLVGLFAVIAFAAATKPVIQQTTWVNRGETSTTASLKVTVGRTSGATLYAYQVVVDGGAPVAATSANTTGIDTTKNPGDVTTGNSITFQVDNVNSSASHKVVVLASDDGFTTNVTSDSSTIKAFETADIYSRSTDLNRAHLTNGTHDKTHGAFKANTSSCASCHSTHQGATTSLFYSASADICESCHDGTLGFYDVVNYESAAGHGNGGAFGGTGSGNSMHDVGSGVDLNAAPGGDITGATSANAAGSGATDQYKWTAELECSSCHNPHGSDSARLLKTDVLGWNTVEHAWGDTSTDTAKTRGQVGTLYKGIQIVDSVPTSKLAYNADKILVRFTNVNITQAPFTTTYASMIFGNISGKDALVTYRWNNTKYEPDFGPIVLDSNLQYNGTTATTAFLAANQLTVFAKIGMFVSPATGAVANATTLNIGYGVGFELLQTKAVINNTVVYHTLNRPFYDSSFKSDNNIILGNLIQGEGSWQYAKFCSACHNDYFSASRSAGSHGAFATQFGHTTVGSYPCNYCHYSHGTTVDIMKDGTGRTPQQLVDQGVFTGATALADAEAYMKDTAATSAIKRYTGNSVCFACHITTHTFQAIKDTATQNAGVAKVGFSNNLDNLGNPMITDEVTTTTSVYFSGTDAKVAN